MPSYEVVTNRCLRDVDVLLSLEPPRDDREGNWLGLSSSRRIDFFKYVRWQVTSLASCGSLDFILGRVSVISQIHCAPNE